MKDEKDMNHQEKLLAYLKEAVDELDDATEFMAGFIGYEDEKAIERREYKEKLIENTRNFIEEYEIHVNNNNTFSVDTLEPSNSNQFIHELSDTKQTLFQSLIQEKLVKNGMDIESEEFKNAIDDSMNSRISNLDELLNENEVTMILELSDHIEMQLVTEEVAKQIIDIREPQGLFYMECEDSYVAIDNGTGEAFTEEFKSLHECIRYLKGEDLSRIYVGDKDVYLIEDDYLDVEVDYEDYYKSPEYTANEVSNFIEENELQPLTNDDGTVIIPTESDGFIVTSDGEYFAIVNDFIESNHNNQPKKIKDNGMEI